MPTTHSYQAHLTAFSDMTAASRTPLSFYRSLSLQSPASSFGAVPATTHMLPDVLLESDEEPAYVEYTHTLRSALMDDSPLPTPGTSPAGHAKSAMRFSQADAGTKKSGGGLPRSALGSDYMLRRRHSEGDMFWSQMAEAKRKSKSCSIAE